MSWKAFNYYYNYPMLIASGLLIPVYTKWQSKEGGGGGGGVDHGTDLPVLPAKDNRHILRNIQGNDE